MAVSNRLVVILVFLIIVNIGFSWFGLMGFISSTQMPQGVDIKDPLTKQAYDPNYYSSSYVILGIIGIFLGIISIWASNFLKINAFGMLLFTEVIWLPFLSTIGILNSMFTSANVPLVFYGSLLGIFTTIMIIIFLYTLAEWSRVSGGI